MTIEQLTEAERRELELRFAWTISAGIIAKALRIIDAHASDRAALVEQARAELECARRERDTWRSLCETAERSRDDAAARADAAEARVRELEAQERNVCKLATHHLERTIEARQQLAAANALLEECLIALFDVPHDPYHELVTNIRAHLSAQPAAPACACRHPEDAEKHGASMCEIDEDEPHQCDWFGRFTCRICGKRREDVHPAPPESSDGAMVLHLQLTEAREERDAANALLGDLKDCRGFGEFLNEHLPRIERHLSAQPAVLSDDLGEALAQVADAEHEHERAAPSLGHPGADEVFARLREARKGAQPAAPEEKPECTGIASKWCPVHGDCMCPLNQYGERTMEYDKCPLHAPGSDHAEATENGRVTTAESDLAQLRARVARAVSELEFSELADEYPTVGRALEALRGE